MVACVSDRRDIVDIPGVGVPAASGLAGSDAPTSGSSAARPFLGIWFKCCHVYGRMYKTDDGARYRGNCPKCGAAVGAAVGEGGTSRRMFEAG